MDLNTEEDEKQEFNLPIDQVMVLPKVKELVPAIQEQLLSGKYDPLKVQIFFKKIGKLAEEVLKGPVGLGISDDIANNIRMYQEGKTSRVFGVEIREQSRSYHDYAQCNDPIWEKLYLIEKQVKELKKKREEELKLTIPSADTGLGIKGDPMIAVPYVPELVLHENTDLAVITPPYKGSRTSFAYYL
tara:strand:- start:33469 stop:34029 length:561 start_codon:yes stop_codon:yes gene_type:complete